jgi:hypothetical protein
MASREPWNRLIYSCKALTACDWVTAFLQEFNLVPPTESNLQLLVDGSLGKLMSRNNPDHGLGLRNVLVGPGQTLFVPSGWIRASFTRLNAIYLHGAFLHTFGAKAQAAVNKLLHEKQVLSFSETDKIIFSEHVGLV